MLAFIASNTLCMRKAVGLINLWAVAAAIAKLAPRPLFTLVPPRR